jgi:hypothetical protein
MRPNSFISFSGQKRQYLANDPRRRTPLKTAQVPESQSGDMDSGSSWEDQYVVHLPNNKDSYRFENEEFLTKIVIAFYVFTKRYQLLNP